MNALHSMSNIRDGLSRAARRIALARRVTSVVIGVALVGAACSSSGDDAVVDTAAAAGPRALVLTARDIETATVADVTTGATISGSLEPAERATVSAQVAGTIGAMSVNRGSRVTRGQRLTTIRAEGVRSQAAGAQANIAAAEAQLVVARTQRDAMRRLYEAGATSRVDVQNAEAAFAAAEAQVAAARAQASAAGEMAGFTNIEAPISGVVSDRPVEPGEAVRVGDAILTIVNTSTLELAGRIPVDEAGAVRVGQSVTFRLDAFPGRDFRGTVSRKDPAADPASRQVGVYVTLPNASGEITAGQFARGQVTGRRVEGAVTVPITAVQGSGADAVVFVVDGARLARRSVTLGPRDEGAGVVAITSGLRAGDRVLVRPTSSIADGQAIVIAADQRVAAPADTSTSAGATADTGRSR